MELSAMTYLSKKEMYRDEILWLGGAMNIPRGFLAYKELSVHETWIGTGDI